MYMYMYNTAHIATCQYAMHMYICICMCNLRKDNDNSYVFKLADFGTARELREDETFISLHGTEEYLYPGMYERALVNPTKRHQFSAQVSVTLLSVTPSLAPGVSS